MAVDRLGLVFKAMAEAGGESDVSVIDRVCVAAVTLLELSGAGLSLMVDGGLKGAAGVSGPGIAAVQELELTLGEGPCVDAWEAREPVLEPDLDDPARARWPAFAEAATAAGVRALFALPMRLGGIRIGVLVLYRNRRGALSEEELALAVVLADVATQTALVLQTGAPEDALHDVLAREPLHWAEVHQATGMVSAQLSIPLDDAFVRLRSYAFANGLPLRDTAREVVARRLRLAGT